VPLAEPHSFSPDDDQPLELDPTSNDNGDDAHMSSIAVGEVNLDTTTSIPNSEYFDEYKFNHQHPDSIYNTSNVTEKMSKDISDKVTTAESLSSMSSTQSGQVYSQSTRKAKESYYIFTGDGIIVKGFLSMGKDDLDNSGTMIVRLHLVSEYQRASDGLSRRVYKAHTNPDPYGQRPFALGGTRTTPNMSKLERSVVYVMRESQELAPIDLDKLRGLKLENDEKIIIMIMNTDDMLIAYSDNARSLLIPSKRN